METSTDTIWHAPVSLDAVRALVAGTLSDHLGIRVVEVGPDYLRGTLPVAPHTHQPFGLLHGGASLVLAEELGSLAGNLCVNPERQACVGLEINANHVRAVRSGTVTGTARPLHLGSRTQVWEIRIVDEQDRLVCVSRITLALVER